MSAGGRKGGSTSWELLIKEIKIDFSADSSSLSLFSSPYSEYLFPPLPLLPASLPPILSLLPNHVGSEGRLAEEFLRVLSRPWTPRESPVHFTVIP